ncbi:MAG: acetylglutamate kinase [Phycisphaerales bacterium]
MPSPLIIKIGGVALEQQRAAASLWLAIATLHSTVPGGVVLVHGGGKAVDALLTKLNMPTNRQEGIRITPPEQMDVIAGVLAGTLNKTLVGAINAASSVRAVGLCLGDGGAMRTTKTTRYSFDPGSVGEVDAKSDGQLLKTLLASNFLPVLCSVGISPEGALLNVNADDAAAGVARVLHARGLVLMTDVPGVKDGSGKLVSRLDAAAIERMIATGEVSGGMIPKVKAALETSRAISAPVTILSGTDTTQFENWASGVSTGTTVAAR